MTADVPLVESSVKQSQTLIAWKRVYIELDKMYKLGATITREGRPNNKNIRVDNVGDFNVGDIVVIFLKDGTQIPRKIERINTKNNQITLDPAPGRVLPLYTGIRPLAEPPTYQVDTRYLEQAFGDAFIEFKPLPTEKGSGSVPKYTEFPSLLDIDSIAYDYAQYWFNNYTLRNQNVLYLLAAKNDASGVMGVYFRDLCFVLIDNNTGKQPNGTYVAPEIQRDETVVHEIGHRFGLSRRVGGAYSYIDTTKNRKLSHDGKEICIMSYDNLDNGVTEFSIDCLLNGSHPGVRRNSLRDSEDK